MKKSRSDNAVVKDMATRVSFANCKTTFEIVDRSIAKYGVDDILYKKHPTLWKELFRGLSFVYALPLVPATADISAGPATVTTPGITCLPELSKSDDESAKQLVHVLTGVPKFGSFDDHHLSNLLSDTDSAILRSIVHYSTTCTPTPAPAPGDIGAAINRIWLVRKENGSCFHLSAFLHDEEYFWHIGSKNSHFIARDDHFLEDLDNISYAGSKFEFAKCLARCFHARVLVGSEDSGLRSRLLTWFCHNPHLSFVGEACLAADPHLVQYTDSGASPEDKIFFFAVSEYSPAGTESPTPDIRRCVAYTPMEAHTLFTTTLGMSLALTVNRLDEICVIPDPEQTSRITQAPIKLSSGHVPVTTAVPESQLAATWGELSRSYEFEENSEGAVVYVGVGPRGETTSSAVLRMFKHKNLYYVVDRSLREAMRRGAGADVFNKRFDFFHLPVHLYCSSSTYNRSHCTPNLSTHFPVSLAVAAAQECGDMANTNGLPFLHYCYAFYSFVEQKIRQHQQGRPVDGVVISAWEDMRVQYLSLKEEFCRSLSREGMLALLRHAGLLVGSSDDLADPAMVTNNNNNTLCGTTASADANAETAAEEKVKLEPEPVLPPAVSLQLPRQVIIAPISIPGVGKSTLLRTLHGLVGGTYLNQDQLNGSVSAFQANIRRHAGPTPTAAAADDTEGGEGEADTSIPSVLLLDKCHHMMKVRNVTISSIIEGYADKKVMSDGADATADREPIILWVQMLHAYDNEASIGGSLKASHDMAMERIKARGTHHQNLIYTAPTSHSGSTPLMDHKYQPRPGVDPNRKLMTVVNGFAQSFEFPREAEHLSLHEHLVKMDARQSVEELTQQLLSALVKLCAEQGWIEPSQQLVFEEDVILSRIAAVKRHEARTEFIDRGASRVQPKATISADTAHKDGRPRLPFQYAGIRYRDSDGDKAERRNTDRICAAVEASIRSIGGDPAEYQCSVVALPVGTAGENNGECQQMPGPDRALALARSCFHTTLLHRTDMWLAKDGVGASTGAGAEHPMAILAPLFGSEVTVTVREVCFDEHIIALPCEIHMATPVKPIATLAVAESAPHDATSSPVLPSTPTPVYCKNVYPHITYGIRDLASYRGTEAESRPEKITGAYSNELLTKLHSEDEMLKRSVHVITLPEPLTFIGTIEKVYY